MFPHHSVSPPSAVNNFIFQNKLQHPGGGELLKHESDVHVMCDNRVLSFVEKKGGRVGSNNGVFLE